MSGFSLRVVLDTVTPKLVRAPNLLRQAIVDELETGGVEMEGDARTYCPVRTGYLQSTIYHNVDPEKLALEIGATADYAPYVELGTRRMAAEPFIRPAFDAGEERLLQALAHGVLFAFQ
jgi:HK97 gp10 family phage protein